MDETFEEIPCRSAMEFNNFERRHFQEEEPEHEASSESSDDQENPVLIAGSLLPLPKTTSWKIGCKNNKTYCPRRLLSFKIWTDRTESISLSHSSTTMPPARNLKPIVSMTA